jgi:hypothetical protein
VRGTAAAADVTLADHERGICAGAKVDHSGDFVGCTNSTARPGTTSFGRSSSQACVGRRRATVRSSAGAGGIAGSGDIEARRNVQPGWLQHGL